MLCLRFLWSCQRQKNHSCNKSDFCAQECTKVVLTVRSLVFFWERADLIFMTGNIFLAGIHQTKQACPYWQPNTRNMNKNVTQFQFGLIPTKIFGVMIVIFGGWDPKFAFQRYQWKCKCRLRRGHSKMLRVLQTVCIEPWTAKGHSARCPTETAGCRCYR